MANSKVTFLTQSSGSNSDTNTLKGSPTATNGGYNFQ